MRSNRLVLRERMCRARVLTLETEAEVLYCLNISFYVVGDEFGMWTRITLIFGIFLSMHPNYEHSLW